MKKLFIAIAVMAVTMTGFSSCSDDDDDLVTVDPAYTNALSAIYPGVADKAEWEVKGEYYVAEFRNDQRQDVDVWFAQGAKWAMTEIDLGRNPLSLPDAVSASYAANDRSIDWTIDDIEYYERPDIVFYVIEIEKAGQRDRDLYYSPDGSLIKDVESDGIDITPTTKI